MQLTQNLLIGRVGEMLGGRVSRVLIKYVTI